MTTDELLNDAVIQSLKNGMKTPYILVSREMIDYSKHEEIAGLALHPHIDDNVFYLVSYSNLSDIIKGKIILH